MNTNTDPLGKIISDLVFHARTLTPNEDSVMIESEATQAINNYTNSRVIEELNGVKPAKVFKGRLSTNHFDGYVMASEHHARVIDQRIAELNQVGAAKRLKQKTDELAEYAQSQISKSNQDTQDWSNGMACFNPERHTSKVLQTPDTQDKLLDFVNDPENIKHAAEGSMEKRQKVIDEAVHEALKARLQSDLKKLSFMFGIPVEDLEKALESKDYS